MLERDRHGPRWSRRRALRGAAVAAVVAAAGVLGSTSWAERSRSRRPGKDVRVTRVLRKPAAAIKLCILPAADTSGECEGSPPEVGATALLFDALGEQIGVIRADAVAMPPEPCDRPATFTFQFIQGSFASAVPHAAHAYAVFGVESGRGDARLLFVDDGMSGIPALDEGDPFIAVDQDRDDQPDVVISTHRCTDIEPPAWSRGATGYRVEAMCMDYWRMDGRDWRQAGRDIRYNCL